MELFFHLSVFILGKESRSSPLLAVYNKPVGIQCTMKDPWGRECLDQLHLQYPFLSSMHPVGRLDTDTSGLLLFSSNGDLTQSLLHPSSNTEREYEAFVLGEIGSVDSLTEKLKQGVETSDGRFPASLLEARATTDLERQMLRSSMGNVTDSNVTATSYLRLTVTEGKYRMVRRILHNSGHSVVNLHRIRYGNIRLKAINSTIDEIEVGSVRPCSSGEINWAKGLIAHKLERKKERTNVPRLIQRRATARTEKKAKVDKQSSKPSF